MSASSKEPPETLIEFPAKLSVKAMGLNDGTFQELIESIVSPHVPGSNAVNYTESASSKAKYVSISAHFTAQNLEQLHAIYADLRAEKRVLYVL